MIISPAISVIIPLYNAENYIAECLESILNQTFQDFEVIVVDDCSTDNSRAVVESYLEKFEGRLKIFSTGKNSGSGALPRNEGLNFSRGEYIQFLDADDMLTKTALEEMYTLAKKYDSDVVYCEKYYEVDNIGSNIQIKFQQEGKLVNEPTFETKDLRNRIQEIINQRFSGMICNKFVDRDLIMENKIFLPNVKTSEDNIWTEGLILCAEKFLRVPNAVYIYRQTKGSSQRAIRTPQQVINFWLNPLIYGLKSLDNFMSRQEFFRLNPQYRCALLENFVHTRFSCIFEASRKISLPEIYDAIKNEFGKDLGEQDVLISFLLADLIEQQKIFVRMSERTAELEKKQVRK